MTIRCRLLLCMLALASVVGLAGLANWQTNRRIQRQVDLLRSNTARELRLATELKDLLQDSQLALHHLNAVKRKKIAKPGDPVERRRVKRAAKAKISVQLEKLPVVLGEARTANRQALRLANKWQQQVLAGEGVDEIADFIEPLERLIQQYIVKVETCLVYLHTDRAKARRYIETDLAPVYRNELLPLIVAYQDDTEQELHDQIAFVEAQLMAANRLSVAVALVAIALALVFGIVQARRIGEPLHRLKMAATCLGSGDLAARADVDSADEIGDLATTFNHMADHLQKSQSALRTESEQRQRAEERARRRHEQLSRMNRASTMGEIMAGLAHELNQPVSASVTFAQTAVRLMRSQAHEPAAVLAPMEKAAEQAKRAGQIVNRLRDYLGCHAPEAGPCAVDEMICEVNELVEREVASLGITTTLQIESDARSVMADKVQLQQVLLNLVRNAIDAVAENPGNQPRHITIRASGQGDEQVTISVSDTGNGAHDESLDRLFEPFYSTKANGMGMGLTISRSIVEAHGGRLWATKNLDGGLTFNFSMRSNCYAIVT